MRDKIISILNFKQACAYIKNGVKPIDVEYNNGKIVFLFKEEDTKEVWEKWKKYELEI